MAQSLLWFFLNLLIISLSEAEQKKYYYFSLSSFPCSLESFGYRTLFAYFYECEKGEITQYSRDINISLMINSGELSYAELPKKYKFCMGVTGTLSTLSEPEKDSLTNIYNINDRHCAHKKKSTFILI